MTKNDLLSKGLLFADLDDTLIQTKSGNKFPKDCDDWQKKQEVWEAIKKLNVKLICIVTNQGGVGKFYTERAVNDKVAIICKQLQEYLGNEIPVAYRMCTSIDKDDPMRKPNTGMLQAFVSLASEYDFKFEPHEMLMIGDASGKPGDFSDSDKMCAHNFGIDYLDVNDFVLLINQ